MKKQKIYCAGPLFNSKEREEMAEIATALEANNYEVFLPHRDGIELSNIAERLTQQGFPVDQTNLLLSTAIFMIDTYQVAASDGLVINLNGRVPDEGAVAEASIAWSLNKPVVIYKNDSRSKINGTDNPLVLGLSSFKIVSSTSDIAKEFDYAFANGFSTPKKEIGDLENTSFLDGERLYKIFTRHGNLTSRNNIQRFVKVLRKMETFRGLEYEPEKEFQS